MKKRKYILVCMVITLMLLTGCQNTTEKEGSLQIVEGEKIIDSYERTIFPSTYQSAGENVTINIEHIEPSDAYFVEGTAQQMQFDYEEIGKLLIPENELGIYEEEAKQMLSAAMVEDGAYEKICMWGKEAFVYYTYQGMQMLNSIRSEKKAGNEYNLSAYEKETVFTFGSADEALEDTIDTLQQMGIEVDENYTMDIYYLQHDILADQEERLDMLGNPLEEEYKDDWSEADDAYLFYIHQNYCELEDYHKSKYDSVYAEDSSAQITVIYGKDGILYLKLQNLSVYEMGNEPVELLPFEDIAGAVTIYFENILDDASYEVMDALLICDYKKSEVLSEKYTLWPVWAFFVKEALPDGSVVYYELRVDAVNGRILQ